MAETNGNTLRYRIEQVERRTDVLDLRTQAFPELVRRVENIERNTEGLAVVKERVRLLDEYTRAEFKNLHDEVGALRKTLIGFAVTVAVSAIGFALVALSVFT